MDERIMIVGITGTLGAGKGTIADYLIGKGFAHYSVRDFLNEELTRQGLELNRDNQVALGNELRAEHSSSYIAEQLFDKANKLGKDAVIESLRTVGEIESLRKKGNFVLFAVDADAGVRYERVIGRQSETDKTSFQKFLDDEEREMLNDDSSKQNISKCVGIADYRFVNNGTKAELYEKVQKVLDVVRDSAVISESVIRNRPSWDEYFLRIGRVVAERSTCDRGSSGCVIVKDKQILVTGYNGSAKGLPHCDEVGHQLKTIVHGDGTASQHCVRTVHGEQNAICQAARHGISLDGATLYYQMTPCAVCAKMIINAGIKRVVCEKRYHGDMDTAELFKQAGIVFEVLNEEFEKYDDM